MITYIKGTIQEHIFCLRILQHNPLGILLVLQAIKCTINKTAWSCICYFRRGFLCLFYVRLTDSCWSHKSILAWSLHQQQTTPENQSKGSIWKISYFYSDVPGVLLKTPTILKVLLLLTRGADAVSIKYVVTPDGLPCGSIQHGPHHLVKGLIGVTPQCALCVFVNEASTKSCRETSKLASHSSCFLNRWIVKYPNESGDTFLSSSLTRRLTSVQRGLVQNQSIFNVIATVAHHGHGGVLSSRQLLKFNNLNGFGFHHRPLRICQQVHKSVDAISLVVADSTWKKDNRQKKKKSLWIFVMATVDGN